jgi:DNA-binding NtrC family response regulator
MTFQTEPLRVLVVDDEKVIADSLAMILMTRGYTARAVYDAEQAIAAADEFQPNAVISDVVMPGMNGVDLAVYFEHQFPECKVLLISGNAAAGTLLEESAKHGHLHMILAKPVHPGQILEFLASCAPVA